MQMIPALQGTVDATGRVNVMALAKKLGEPASALAPAIGLTATSIRRNPTSERAQPAARRIFAVMQHAVRTFGDLPDAMLWMRTPHPDLDEKAPLDLIKGGEVDTIEGMLHMIDTGQPG